MIHGTKLAIAFLATSLTFLITILLRPFVQFDATKNLEFLGTGLVVVALLYFVLRKTLEPKMTYTAFLLTITLGIGVFFLAILL